jgi:hypothetical protein
LKKCEVGADGKSKDDDFNPFVSSGIRPLPERGKLLFDQSSRKPETNKSRNVEDKQSNLVGRTKRGVYDKLRQKISSLSSITSTRIRNTAKQLSTAVKDVYRVSLSPAAKAVQKAPFSTNTIQNYVESSKNPKKKYASRVFMFKHVLNFGHIAADPEKFLSHFLDMGLKLHNHDLLPTFHSSNPTENADELKKWYGKAENNKLTLITGDIEAVSEDIKAVRKKVSWNDIKHELFFLH